MILQARIQVVPIEVVDPVCAASIDRARADVFADHSSFAGFDQPVIPASPGTALGLLDQQPIHQLGHRFVDEPLPLSL